MLRLQMPNLRYGRILWTGFLLIVLLILIGAIARKRNSFAENVSVVVSPLKNGEKLISEADVKQALLRAFGNTLEGTELAYLEVERIERVLEEDAFIADAEAYVDQKNVLHVDVKQRAPMLRIMDNRGGNYYLDQNGVKMPPSKNYTARVMVITGNVSPYTPEFMDKKRTSLKDAFQLCRYLLEDDLLGSFIQQIHVNQAGEFVLVPLVGGQKILLGSARKLEDKCKRLKTFYQEGMPYAGWRAYESISLKYAGQVVCRK